MKITICGSMMFSKEMIDLKNKLSVKGHSVVIPENAEEYLNDEALSKRAAGWGTLEGAQRKIDNDLIKKHYREIVDCDAVLSRPERSRVFRLPQLFSSSHHGWTVSETRGASRVRRDCI